MSRYYCTSSEYITDLEKWQILESIGREYEHLDIISLRLILLDNLISFKLINDVDVELILGTKYNYLESEYDINSLINLYESDMKSRRYLNNLEVLSKIRINILDNQKELLLPRQYIDVNIHKFKDLVRWYEINYYTKNCGKYNIIPVCYSGFITNKIINGGDVSDISYSNYISDVNNIDNMSNINDSKQEYDSREYEFKYIPPKHLVSILEVIKFDDNGGLFWTELLSLIEYNYVVNNKEVDDVDSILYLIDTYNVDPTWIIAYPLIYKSINKNNNTDDIMKVLEKIRDISSSYDRANRVTNKWFINAVKSVGDDSELVPILWDINIRDISKIRNNLDEIATLYKLGYELDVDTKTYLTDIATFSSYDEYTEWATEQLLLLQ